MDINEEDLFNSEFLKQFNDSGEFSNFMEELYRRGVEKMLGRSNNQIIYK